MDKQKVCIELKTGCVIVGCLYLIEALIYIYFNGKRLAAGIVEFHTPREYQKFLTEIIMVLSTLMVLCAVLMVAFTIVLFIGLLMNKPSLVKAFLNYSHVYIMISTWYLIGLFVVFVTRIRTVIMLMFTVIATVKYSLRLVVKGQHCVMMKASNDPVLKNTA